MKPTILCIQFRVSPESLAHEQACMEREIGESARCVFISALDESLDWVNPQSLLLGKHGVVLGGSGDFDFDGGRPVDDPSRTMSYVLLERLRPLCEYIFEHDMPTLGICYGHQLVGAFAGARVHNDHVQKKSRSHAVRVVAEAGGHALLAGVPDSFSAIYGHKDSLDRVPDGAVLLVEGGTSCRVSALRYKNNIVTTQFHPELTLEDIMARLKSSPGYLPEGTVFEDIFRESTDSNLIIKNFGTFVAAYGQ